MKAVNLKCDGLYTPLGISIHKPVLSWICSDGVRETGYDIRAEVDNNTVWESGNVSSSSMHILCPYEGKPRERIKWTIRLSDENGIWGEESTSWYEYGIKNDNWKAKWINPELERERKKRKPASVLRKEFNIDSLKENSSSRLYITCHGMYEALINGRRVGDYVLAPGVDNYNKCLRVQCYDVTSLLVEGRNEISVTLGDGLYRGNNGIDGSCNLSGDDIALLFQLEIDGIPVVVSDSTWLSSQDGPVGENDTELGETQDARKEIITSWHGVKEENYGFDNLVSDESVPVCEQEKFEGKLIITPNGEKVIDYGQNIAGYTTLTLDADEGDTIVLYHGETLDKDGNFTQSNYAPGKRNRNGGIPQKLTFICKKGKNIFHPKFCIFGFRYAKVETGIDLSGAVFTAVAVYSKMAQTGFFECGNRDVERLFLNTLWSMKSNFVDIPTDCPTRERAGWTGDAGVFSPTAVYLADCYPVLRKWLSCCRYEQKKNGVVSNIAPANNVTGIITRIIRGSAGWGDASVIVPWTLYKAYGDETILKENYSMMVKWVKFCRKRAGSTRKKNRKNPWRKYLVDRGFHFGEWLEPDIPGMEAMKNNMKNGAEEVATAYFFLSSSLLSRIAGILGKKEDEKEFSEMARNARSAYRFTCTENGIIHSSRQCAYVRPVAFGLLSEEEKEKAVERLSKLVEENGYHLNTGFLSTPFLCDVLSRYGRCDTAYRLLLQDTVPGWLYAVKKGATTIWETWDGIREDGSIHDSFNHYSYGAVTGWLFSGVCGISLEEGRFIIRPVPDRRLRYASSRWDSPVGRVESGWKYKEDELVLSISIPPNTEGCINLPDGTEYRVSAGHYEYVIKEENIK